MPFATTAIIAASVAVGVGTSIYGAVKQQEGYDKMEEGQRIQQEAQQRQAEAAKEMYGYSKNIVQHEQGQEAIRRQAMEIDASRNKLQVLRQAQQAQAMGVAAAFNQGAQYGSGLQGGKAQVSSAAGFNILGINQALYQGRGMFDLNAQISQEKLNIADAQTKISNAQGDVYRGQGMAQLGQATVGQGSSYMALGGQIVSAAGTLSNIAGFGGPKSGAYGQGASSMSYSPTSYYNPGPYSSSSY